MARWRAELDGIGLHPVDLIRSVERAPAELPTPGATLTDGELSALVVRLVAGDGPLARRKVFSRRDVLVAAAPAVYGRDPVELAWVAAAVLRDREVVPL